MPSVTIDNLTNGTQYTFYIRAINAVGPGLPATVQATPVAAPISPTNFIATRGNGQISCTWDAPVNDGGSAITSYDVSSDGGGTWTSAALNMAYVFTGLTNGTLYNLQVRAVNGVGPGAPATTTATPATTPGVPTSFVGVSGNGFIACTWVAPANNGGSPITGYEVSSDGGGTWGHIGNATSYTFTDLTNGTLYSLQVRAVNDVGASAAATTTGTPVTVPGTPTSLSATPGDTAVTLTWVAPADDGGTAITGYEYSLDGNTWSTVTTT
jgi:titin